ncbi:hypothetical protein SLEP1_g20490 [Rubroshorea leprosula]|uniref:Major facilitator superfamily (MFS) profile domain-containing protein n=1 Tax=Rubroshorea leprosula TaxID=152421 RepID=A0AAV5JEU3_9ROSI|nr:hypothetical protein SLEP1_g20490 [Rubroshorea leprosula]
MAGEESTEQLSSSLLAEENPSTRGPDGGNSATAVLVLSTFIAVCGSYISGAIVGYSSPTETGIMEDLGLSTAEYSVFGSTVTIGAMVGAVFSGKIADLIGRRGAMGISEAFSIAGWLAIAFSQAAWLLDIGRLSTGCGLGLLTYVVPVYIAEITPKNLRGRFATVHPFMITVGIAMTYFIGTVVSWRILALIGTIPCIVNLLGLFFISESPRWLAKVGKEKEYEAALLCLRGENTDISEEAIEIKENTEALQRLPEGRILELFQRRYARSLIIGVGLVLLNQLGGSIAISAYASSIFEKAGFSTTVGTIVMSVVQIPMTIGSVLLMDKSGRRQLLMVSCSGTCFGCLLVGVSFLLQDVHWWKELTPVLVFIGLVIYNAFFGLGLSGIPWLIMSEIFPINMKGSAGSLCNLVYWSSSWFMTYMFNFSMEWSSAGTFFILSGIAGFTVGFVAKIVPETKGRTLEEIQAVLNPEIVKG